MEFKVNKSKCAGCGACLKVCPHGAIKIGEDGKAFINQNKCKKCVKCQRICPFDAIEEIPEEDKENIKQPRTSAPTQIPYGSSIAGRQGLGFGRGLGKGLGRGSRDGRGGGRGGGGRS